MPLRGSKAPRVTKPVRRVQKPSIASFIRAVVKLNDDSYGSPQGYMDSLTVVSGIGRRFIDGYLSGYSSRFITDPTIRRSLGFPSYTPPYIP